MTSNGICSVKKLVEIKRKTGHCGVPQRHERDESLAGAVGSDAANLPSHEQNATGPKGPLLEELEFMWNVDGGGNYDKQWRQQH
jgi:hypothetical protein